MKILPGDSIGRYHILEQLGEGGMAGVYKAYDTRLEREVAIKFLRTELFGEAVLEQLYKRFEREAKALARLSHFHIVKIHDFGEYENTPYLVMEYVPGGTLKSRMGKPIPWRDAFEVLLPVARAVEYAHQHGVLHRDIKPSNILIAEDGEPLLSDFGIAKILETGESQAITTTGVGIGTPEYMAPEQGLAKGVDARTDVYSLGVVLYEMLTGRKPYTADTPTAILIKQAHDPLPNPMDYVPDLPFDVVKVLLKALAKQPEFRYASMADMVNAMEGLLRPQPTEAPQPATIASEWRPDIKKIAAEPAAEAPAKSEMGEPAPTVMAAKPSAEPAPAQPPPPAAKEPARPPVSREGQAAAPAAAVKKPFKIWWIAAPILAVAAIAIGLVLGLNLPEKAQPTPLPTIAPVTPAPTKAPVTPVPTARPKPTEQPVVVQPTAGEIIKIGVILPLSGSQSGYGSMFMKGVQLAVDQWNERGGVLGRIVIPIFKDGQCTADPTLNAANFLVSEEQVQFIIGEVCSRATIPLAEFTNSHGVIHIVTVATNPQVTVDEKGTTRPFTFRVCLVDPLQGVVAARFAYENLSVRRVFAIYEQDNPYSQNLAEAFMNTSKDLGSDYSSGLGYPPGTDDFSNVLKKIDFVKPDLIYLPTTYDVVNNFLRQAREHGIQVPFLGSDGWDSPELDLKLAAGSYITTHYWMGDPRPELLEFRDTFGAHFQDEQGKPIIPDVFAALSYDGANLLLNAITDAGTADAEAVRSTLERIEFHGLTGTIHFDPQHNPIKPAVILAVTPDGFVFQGLVKP